MDKRQTDRLTDRLTVSPITKQLVNFVIDKWTKKVIMTIKFEQKQSGQTTGRS